MIRVLLEPDAKPIERQASGVDVVIAKMHEHLPSAGIQLVKSGEPYDVLAAHIWSDQTLGVLHSHGIYPTATKGSPSWMFELNKKCIESAKTASYVTVPSPWVAQLYARDMGFVPVVVPHGIDISQWQEPEYKMKRFAVWNKNRDADLCTPVPMNMIAAIMPDTRFVSTFGVPQANVSVTGSMYFPAMHDLLYKCGGAYLATTKETFGVGTLEAMAAGMPVLGWRWGHTPHLVEHEVTGYIVDPGDIEGSKRGLEYIYDNYERMSRAARSVAMTYDWSSVALQYADVYKWAAEREIEDKNPLVSIIIPCYNYSKYVLDAIRSVKAQTYENIECIIVDDGSVDDSPVAIYGAIQGDDRFKMIQQRNAGVATARNHGATVSKGRFLMFLDADDFLYPDTVTMFASQLVRDRTLGLVYGGITIVNEDGAKLTGVSEWPGEFVLADQMAQKNQVPSCNLMRREAFFRAGGFRSHFKTGEDAELWTRIPLVGFNIRKATPHPVYNYRLHNGALSDDLRTGKVKETPWTQYIAACNGGHQPFASIVPPDNGFSHPVPVYDEPLLSIIIACGPNHGGLLVNAIESVAAQTDNHWELIIVDDTDDGDLATKGYHSYNDKYPFIKWLRSPKLHNVSAARNFGAANSAGRYLAFLDADDYLLPMFVEKTLNVIRGCENDGSLVYTDWISMPGNEAHQAENWSLDRLMDHALFAVTFVHPKSSWRDCGGFSEDLSLWEDWDYTIKLAMEGMKGIRVPLALFAYRYDTGKRREDSLLHQDELLRTIRSKYALIKPKPRKG